jgi:hypothetical protein
MEAKEVFAEVLLDKLREDTYPSTTQMNMLEEFMPPQVVPEYFQMLLERVRTDKYPSVPMMQRVQRIAETML